MQQPTSEWHRVILLTKLPGYPAAPERYSAMRRFLVTHTPLTAARPAGNEAELLSALDIAQASPDENGVAYVMIVKPLLTAGTAEGPWPEGGLRLKTHVVMGCAGASGCIGPNDPQQVGDLCFSEFAHVQRNLGPDYRMPAP